MIIVTPSLFWLLIGSASHGRVGARTVINRDLCKNLELTVVSTIHNDLKGAYHTHAIKTKFLAKTNVHTQRAVSYKPLAPLPKGTDRRRNSTFVADISKGHMIPMHRNDVSGLTCNVGEQVEMRMRR
jgi:hypothetical protein